MTQFVPIALFGWIPCVIVLFALMPVRKAAATAVVGASLLLPPAGLMIDGLPNYSKNSATAIGIILGTFLFGLDHLLKFRPRWFDLPMFFWCFTGVASSLHNGLGPYDGLSDALNQLTVWGLPYLFGRLYFSDPQGLRSLTVAMVIGGLCYVLPCLWEIKMSPQLLHNVYGLTEGVSLRLGGWRPVVFCSNGIELGMWMTAASLTGWWLWQCGTLKTVGQIPFGWTLLLLLLGTTVLCRSSGSLILLAAGIFILWASIRFQTRKLLWALLLIAPLYVALRVPNIWSGKRLVELAEICFGEERAKSLADRFKYENLLVAKAVQQPVWGWAGWGRADVYFDEIQDASHRVPGDGLWIGTLVRKGSVGLILVYLVFALPLILFLRRFPVRIWHYPQVAPLTLAAVFLGVYLIECLANGWVIMIYLSLAGGLIGMTPAQFALGRTGWRGTKVNVDQASRILQKTPIGIGPRRDPNINEQSYQGLPRSISARMALADRYQTLGRSLKSEGRWVDAFSAWQQAFDTSTELMRRNSDIPSVRRYWCDCGNNLAWLLVNHPESDSRGVAYALTLATQVVNECSDCEVYWNTLGAAYLRTGDLGAAIAAVDRSMALADEGSPFNHVLLAMAYSRMGDPEQGQHWLAQAILRKEQDYPNHLELARLCDEASAVVNTSPEAPGADRELEANNPDSGAEKQDVR